HVEQRHDLLLLAFRAWRSALPWFPVAAYAEAEVAALVEMLADDVARRDVQDRDLARAILAVGSSGVSGAEPAETSTRGSDRFRGLVTRPGARTALRRPTPPSAPPEPIGIRTLGPRQGWPVAQSKFERLREAAALQRSLRETHGDEAEEVLAEHIAQTSSGGLAPATFDAAIARNRRAGVRFQLRGGGLPGKLLHPA